MKKILCLFLLLSLLVTGLLVSCGENDDGGSKDTTKIEETEKQYLDDLPSDLKFEQEEVKFLTAENGGLLSQRSIGLADYVLGQSNAVDDAIFKRNQKTEERLGVVIDQVVGSESIVRGAYYSSIQAGNSEFDIYSGTQGYDLNMTLKGLVVELSNLGEYDADYIDTSAEYWAQSYVTIGAYKGLLFWITGDIALRYIGGVYCTYVNTEAYSDALETTHGSIYKMAEDGKWTMDILATMAKECYQDTGKQVGKVDDGDFLGFIIGNHDPLMGLMSACDVHYTDTDPGGNAYLMLTSDNENLLGFADKVNQICKKDGCAMNTEEPTPAIETFAKGTVMFCVDKLFVTETYLTNMENYGIIPPPKLDEDQKEYRSFVNGGCSIYAISVNCENIPAAAATLESMASLSLQLVTPEYYDMALKYRYTRDEDSANMIELIRASAYVDFGGIWRSVLEATGNTVSNLVNTLIKTGASVSTIKTYENAWEKALDGLLVEFDKYFVNGTFATE